MSQPPVNDHHEPQAQPERTQPVSPGRKYVDEDRAWSQLYTAVLQGQPSTAEEVVNALDADPKAKHFRLALYTHAKTTLRKQKASQLRKQRIASFLNSVLAVLFLSPMRQLRLMLSNSTDVAVEMLPSGKAEPAKARASVLHIDPTFVESKQKFDGVGEAPAVVATPEASRNPKAA
jgi:hypothetical protein